MCDFQRPQKAASIPSIGELAALINGVNEFVKLFEAEPKTKENLAIDVITTLKHGYITKQKAIEMLKMILEDEPMKSASPKVVNLPRLPRSASDPQTEELIRLLSKLGG